MSVLRFIVKKALSLISDDLLKLGVLSVTFEVKRRNASRLMERSGFKAVGGPFAGVTMLEATHAGANQEIFGQAIGTYEPPVTKVLTERNWGAFIDIGAESGFYVASMLASGFCRTAYAFEMNEESRAEMQKRLELNSVNASILGFADTRTIVDLVRDQKLNQADTLILCDIEGGEFDLFTADLLRELSQCTLVIELHDPNDDFTQILIEALSATHDIELKFRDEWHAPYLSSHELDPLSDHEKMLLISEGREYAQSWMVARPKKA